MSDNKTVLHRYGEEVWNQGKLGLIDEDIGDVNTLSGFIVKKLGRWPKVGDTVMLGEFVLKVQSLSQKRVGQVLISRASEQPAEHAAQNPLR